MIYKTKGMTHMIHLCLVQKHILHVSTNEGIGPTPHFIISIDTDFDIEAQCRRSLPSKTVRKVETRRQE